jgi:hypothetical protein
VTPKQAAALAAKRGYYFYFDRGQRMWACYMQGDDAPEATYHTAATLAGITPDRFQTVYLPIKEG